MKLSPFLLAAGYFSLVMGYYNIASEGSATQCDDRYGAFASLAIDGNTDPNFHSGSVTHTSAEGDLAWWKLTFSTDYYISEIRVWNRMDCCSGRLVGATVWVDGKKVGRVDDDGPFFRFLNLNVIASKVKIQGGPGQGRLCLAEVEVFGEAKDYRNIASEGVAFQSDDKYSPMGLAEVAIDGNTNGNWYARSVTHTKGGGRNAHWSLRFNSNRYIHSIVLYNRVDSCQKRIDNYLVLLDNQYVGLVHYENGKTSYVFVVDKHGKEIRIEGSTYVVSLAEVKVIGN